MEFIELLKVILFGIVEGITEWLPVSSTGHLILFDKFLPLNFSPAFMDMFEYVIQLAAILAVVVIFWKRVCPIGLKKAQPTEETLQAPNKGGLCWKKDSLTMWGKVIVACVPALLALVIDKLFLENLSETAETIMIASTLIVYGVAFILIEKWNENKTAKVTEIANLSWKNAFFIGCFQVLAAIPGSCLGRWILYHLSHLAGSPASIIVRK